MLFCEEALIIFLSDWSSLSFRWHSVLLMLFGILTYLVSSLVDSVFFTIVNILCLIFPDFVFLPIVFSFFPFYLSNLLLWDLVPLARSWA